MKTIVTCAETVFLFNYCLPVVIAEWGQLLLNLGGW